MTLYIIRVELHGAQAHHYTDLAKKLASHGITDIISSGDGKKWKLPPAEYCYSGSEKASDVLKAVKNVANSVISSNAVLVTEAVSSTWDGLKQVVSQSVY